MTFFVEIKKLPRSEVEIVGEIPAADFARAVGRSLAEWNQKIELDGFRPGNIPEKILRDNVGSTAILERAAEIALAEAYPAILEEQKLDAIGHPRVSITKLAEGNPLGFAAVTTVAPEVTLADYKAIAARIAAKKETIAIEEKDVAEALDYLRSSHATKKEDGTEEKPVINDAFAQTLGQKTLDDLKKLLSENIQKDKERTAKDKKRMEILDAVAKESSMDIPELLIRHEKDAMIAELKESLAGMHLPWEDYLKHVKKTEDDLRTDWQEEALRRTRYSLVIRAIAEREAIEPPEADVKSRMEAILARMPESERSKVDKANLAGYAYGILRNERVFALLEKTES